MNPDLPQRVRSVLQRVLEQLGTAPRVQREAQQTSMQQLKAWCEQHAVETHPWFGSHSVCFDRKVLARIEQTLAELGVHRLDNDLRQQDRFAQSDHSRVEHKHVGLTPKERRVLVAQANCGAYFPQWVKAAPSQWVMDIEWQTLELNVFPGLVVVENLDSFYAYFTHHPTRYVLPELALQALVVYRGDGMESRACKALVEAFKLTGKPIIYFGDYDSAGLSIALHGAYSHVLLPSLDSLLANATDQAQPATQLHQGHSLASHVAQLPVEHPLAAYLTHNQKHQKGLRQQGFKGPLQVLSMG